MIASDVRFAVALVRSFAAVRSPSYIAWQRVQPSGSAFRTLRRVSYRSCAGHDEQTTLGLSYVFTRVVTSLKLLRAQFRLRRAAEGRFRISPRSGRQHLTNSLIEGATTSPSVLGQNTNAAHVGGDPEQTAVIRLLKDQ